MKNLFLALVTISLFTLSCGNATKDDATKTDTATALTFDVDSLINNLDSLVGKTVKVSGTVDHVCKHGGKRMFLFNADPENRIKVVVGDEQSSFDAGWETSDVTVEGIVEELRIDEKYLVEWEAEIAAEETTTEKSSTEKSEEDKDANAHAGGKGESADMGKHTEAYDQIKEYRAQIAQSEKGYLSFYSIKSNKVTPPAK